jgi:hypothetical protein
MTTFSANLIEIFSKFQICSWPGGLHFAFVVVVVVVDVLFGSNHADVSVVSKLVNTI